MLVLDENLPAAQQLWLRKWRIHFRLIGADVAGWGTRDENLLRLCTGCGDPPLSVWTGIFTAPVGPTRITPWFGWMWQMTRRPNSSAAFSGTRHSTLMPSEWAR